MKDIKDYVLIKEGEIPELRTVAMLYRHRKTGAEIFSLVNDDENKVFGVTFRTPPKDSTGIAHILEHSVLCGSRKYPVKEPFVELLKGSLQTFLNAFTYPDKTCYVVASQNLKDFHNLIDVYLDAVFFPRLASSVFQQEGWHFHLDDLKQPLIYRGVVFNEMKGAYSSPDRILMEYSQHSLFPDTPYGLESGGDPRHIPDLTYEAFQTFHRDYYHPSNARFFFYGDDDSNERLKIIDKYLNDFEEKDIHSFVSLQKPFKRPRRSARSFTCGEDQEGLLKGMMTVNWLLTETVPPETNLALHILEFILIGMPASPLRKALIESGLGEDVAGIGLEGELRQMYFSTGLKGIDLKDADKVESLISNTLNGLIDNGINPQTVEAALNSVEFGLRENNSGGYPRGLLLMLRCLTVWLYDQDPFLLLAFEKPLEAVKKRIRSEKLFFESLITRFLLDNPHKTIITLEPDPHFREKEEKEEQRRLKKVRAGMNDMDLKEVLENVRMLKKLQEKPDSAKALATIPSFKLHDLDKENKPIPLDVLQEETNVLYHDLLTNGIAYLDLGFDLHVLPKRYLPYVPLFGRALLEMGTEAQDYVSLIQRIRGKTGGIRSQTITLTKRDGAESVIRLILRGKVILSRVDELLNILSEILLTTLFDDQERFRQIVLEEKAKQEYNMVPLGHRIVDLRLRAHFSEADWVAEQMRGVSYLFFLRELSRAVDDNWPAVLNTLEEVRRLLVNRKGIIVNVTLDHEGWPSVLSLLRKFLDGFPESPIEKQCWQPAEMPRFEGLVIPSLVNYVGKGANIYQIGYRFHGSSLVISHYLRTAWLWNHVRVRGGAYGVSSVFDRFSGGLTFVSYRDPNLQDTLDAYDQTADYLRNIQLSDEELTKGIIGVIGDIDQHRLPDAKGYTSLLRYECGDDDKNRRQMREEVLGTTVSHFKEFGEVLSQFGAGGLVKVLGSESSLKAGVKEHAQRLKITKVL